MKPIHPLDLIEFQTWLVAQGCKILEPDGPSDLLRFSTPRGINVLRQSKFGKQSCVGIDLGAALSSWRLDLPWRLPQKRSVDRPVKKSTMIRLIVERDGRGCWYCGASIEHGWTIEHLLASKYGGRTVIENVVLACQPCNNEAGTMSIAKKVQLRERKLGLIAPVARASTGEPMVADAGERQNVA